MTDIPDIIREMKQKEQQITESKNEVQKEKNHFLLHESLNDTDFFDDLWFHIWRML